MTPEGKRTRNRIYYAANRLDILARLKTRREANPEKRKAYARAYYQANRERICASVRAWRRAHPAYARSSSLRKYGGFTLEQEAAMVAAQGGICALCGDRSPLVVDHDHATGRVRALLCDACNKGLGFFRDDPLRLLAALAYLDRSALG